MSRESIVSLLGEPDEVQKSSQEVELCSYLVGRTMAVGRNRAGEDLYLVVGLSAGKTLSFCDVSRRLVGDSPEKTEKTRKLVAIWERPSNIYARDKIVGELAEGCLRVGMTEFEVVRLLGEPQDGAAKTGFATIYGVPDSTLFLLYDAGYEQNFFLNTLTYLYIELDQDRTLREYRVIRGLD